MKRRKLILGAAACAAIVILAAFVSYALLQDDGYRYTMKMSQGEKYMDRGDYSRAIVAFRTALEIDDSQPEAYITLYRAYQGAGYDELALSILETGVNATGSERLRLILAKALPAADEEEKDAGTAVAADSGTEAAPGAGQTAALTLDTDLLSFLAAANYGQYLARYGGMTCSPSGDGLTARSDALGGSLYFADTATARVIDSARGEPYNSFLPSGISLDDICVLFGGRASLTFAELGRLRGVSGLTRTGDSVTFSACGCSVTVACDADGTIRSGADNTIVPSGTGQGGSYVLTGAVLDASTGRRVSGASLLVYQGGTASGEAAEAESGADGSYSLALEESGAHTVVVSKNGYISDSFDVYVNPSAESMEKDFAISPVLGSGQIRIVLTWGSSPTDLDSYLSGSTDSGISVFTSYYSMSSGGVATLDVDDTDGYGPETTTILDMNGVYYFSVLDFTESGTMSSSGAEVRIYSGSSLVQTVSICPGLRNGWNVCKIDHGTVTVYNSAL